MYLCSNVYVFFFFCKTHFFCPSGCRLADLSVRLSYISIYFQCKTTSLGVSDWKHSKYSKKKQKQPQIVTLNFVTPVTTKPHNAQRQSTVDGRHSLRHPSPNYYAVVSPLVFMAKQSTVLCVCDSSFIPSKILH